MLGAQQDRRYQVFISSTYLDLKEERQEVTKAILELNCFPAGMELFPASDDEKWDLIKQVIDDSDYYIVILGGRYGSVDDEGLSFTEKEYDYAVSVKKPVLGFVHGDSGQIIQDKSEMNPKAQKRLGAFRQKVEKRMCKRWKTPEELGSVVSRSLVQEMNRRPASGWVRGDNALTPELTEELAGLRKRVAEAETALDRSRTTAPDRANALSQGTELVELAYEFSNHVAISEWEVETRYVGGSVDASWDLIFGRVGPLLMDEAEDGALRSRLNHVAEELARSSPSWPKFGDAHGFSVHQPSFDQVKVQLVALGLIRKSERKRGVNVKGAFWILTPYGETYLMTLLAIPSGGRANVAPPGTDDDEISTG